VLLPWAWLLCTVRSLGAVYAAAPPAALAACLGFGFLWGCGSQLFGLGVDALGNSLGFAIILGLTATLGSVVPLVLQHPQEAGSPKGCCNFAALGLTVAGLVLCAWAGRMKEVALAAPAAKTEGLPGSKLPPGRSSFAFGLVVCLLSGVFSPCLNFAVTFGSSIKDRAQVIGGASETMAANAVAALAVSAGSVPNLCYCAYLLRRQGTWKALVPFSGQAGQQLLSLLVCLAMGILWFAGFAMYGMAVDLLGSLGAVVGWPLYINCMIITANVSGIATGEWRGSPSTAKGVMAGGLIALCIAVAVIGYSNSL